jgi:hypothetical protein
MRCSPWRFKSKIPLDTALLLELMVFLPLHFMCQPLYTVLSLRLITNPLFRLPLAPILTTLISPPT